MPVIERVPASEKRLASPNDGTRQLLQWGSSMVGAGVLAAIVLQTLLGGFGPSGASTNTGWFAHHGRSPLQKLARAIVG